jgi:hypothetical protein
VVEVDGRDRDFGGHEAEVAVLEDGGDGRLVEKTLACERRNMAVSKCKSILPVGGTRTETLEVRRQDGEVGVSGEVVDHTVRGSVVQCLATLGSDDAVNDRAQLGSVCVVRGQANDSRWQETGDGGVVDEPMWHSQDDAAAGDR